MVTQAESDDFLAHGENLYNLGEVEASEECFRKVIESKANLSQGYYGLGLVALSKNSLDQATDFFNQALKEDSNNSNAIYQLGVIAELYKKWEVALAYYKQALAIYPQHISARERSLLVQNYLGSLPPKGIQGCLGLLVKFIFGLIVYVILFSALIYIGNMLIVNYPAYTGGSTTLTILIFSEEMLVAAIGLSALVNILYAIWYWLRSW